jgi:hypothetical protein
MLRIHVFDSTKRRWVEIPNGPFPITPEQMNEARRRYTEEWNRCAPLEGVRMSPQTTARDILKDVAPHLNDFDRGMLGFAVSNNRVQYEPELEGI